MKLQIITPVKLVKETEISSVTLPTVQGEITILPKHQSLLTLLQEGLVTYKSSGSAESLAIGGGYAQTDGELVRVLVSKAYGQDEIDEKLNQQAIEHAQAILRDSKNMQEKADARAILRRSVLDSKLIKRHRTRTSL